MVTKYQVRLGVLLGVSWGDPWRVFSTLTDWYNNNSWAVWREIASNSAVILSIAQENQFPKVLLLLLFVCLLCQKKGWPFKKLWNCTTSNLLFLFSKISSNRWISKSNTRNILLLLLFVFDLSKICEIAPRPTQKTNSWKFYCCFVLFVYLLIKIKDWTFKKMWNCSTSNLGWLFSKLSSNCRDTEKVVHDSFTKLFCVARKTNSKRKICCFLCLCQKSWIIQTKPVKLKHVTLKLIWRHTHFPCFQNSRQIFETKIYLCSF